MQTSTKVKEYPFDPEFHWHHFPEFIKHKLSIGEPSPHLQVMGYLIKDLPWEEKVWKLGCYAAPYSLITAEILGSYWTAENVRDHPNDLLLWLKENWSGILTSTERRCVRTPEKMARCLVEYAGWTKAKAPALLEIHGSPQERYEQIWDSVTTVYSIGRYIAIRLIEGFNRFADVPAKLYDIRSIGAWSPKKMLAFMYPEYKEQLLSTDSKIGAVATIKISNMAMEKLASYGLDIGHYIFAAMLCEYRKAAEDGHEYPAQTHDKEISYYNKQIEFWQSKGFQSRLFEARKALFPSEVLGELQGWTGIRKDLGRVLINHEYVWSDLIFDYHKSKDHLEEPVLR